MASAELQSVIEMLRTTPIVGGATVAEMRASMEAATTLMPLPEDVGYEPVDAGGVRAEWTTAPGAARDRVVVYFHGGGYVAGSFATHRLLVAGIARATGVRLLSVAYRLRPEHRFPAAVEDACAAYRFIRQSAIAPTRIAFAGDSAGGGLTVAALVALRDAGEPLPAAGICISPWLDLALAGDSMTTRAHLDPMLSRERLAMMASSYLGGADPRSPTASPLYAHLAGLPPLLVQVGSAEVLHDDSTRFAERARAAGVPVTLETWQDMIHDWHAFALVLPEGQQAIDRIGAFLRERLR